MADLPDNSQTDILLSVGESMLSDIADPDDRDWVALTLEAGKTYRIELDGVGSNALGDPYIYGLFDGDGQSLDRFDNDGGGAPDARLVYSATESGTYYVEVGSWFLTTCGSGGQRHVRGYCPRGLDRHRGRQLWWWRAAQRRHTIPLWEGAGMMSSTLVPGVTACGFGSMAEVLDAAHADTGGVRLPFADTELFLEGLTLTAFSAASILF
jgi:hypothetical protein